MSVAYRLVDSTAGLNRAVGELSEQLAESDRPRLYLDTEFESNRQGTKLCLLQVTAGSAIYLIDALRIADLTALSPVFLESEWVLHAGLQDVQLLCDALHQKPPKRIFDTQIAWALLSPEASVGLSYLKYVLLQLRSEKGHQADDWVRRPLQESQLRYAAEDVAELPRLVTQLMTRATSQARVEVIYAASRDALSPQKAPPPPLALSSLRNAWQLSPRSQAALLYLIDWYNDLPSSVRRQAPEAKALLSIAARCPHDVGSLGRIKGVGRGVVEKFGKTLVAGIRAAERQATDEDFIPLDPPPYATYEEIKLDAWFGQFRADLAVQLRCAPEFVVPGRLLKNMKAAFLVEGPPGLVASVSGWRRDFLSDWLEQYIEAHPPATIENS